MRYLGGEAKRELLVMDNRDNIDEIFRLLQNIYGESIPLTTLLTKFYARSQQTSEGIRNYALTLRELVYKIKQVAPESVSDKLIRDKFVEGINSTYIKCEVKRAIRTNPDLTFDKAITEAITLEGERLEYESMGEDTTIQLQRLDKSRPQKDTPELVRLRDTIQDLQKKTVNLEGKLEQSSHHTEATMPPPSRKQQFRFTEDGMPICWKCNGTGHMGRDSGRYFQQSHLYDMDQARQQPRQQPRQPQWWGNDGRPLN
ncbi:hypothetical protein HOLleu_42615 [Holothuria leucospilota]|uniref:Uncharacterized protein n=1 Tax=Holothuria leucospilota TaxID=206669 RepID=A0A9Q1BBI7_HOLLE|nr:hypothetical protein HOLleu_42615 [Holothuria leucospilota]